MCPIPWRYQSSRTLRTLSYQGVALKYGGGGFVADLGYNEEIANDVVDTLEANNWVDGNTAVILMEFTIFEPSSLLFSAVKYVYEKFPTGGSHTGIKVNTLTVYSATNAQFEAFYQVCRLFLMIVIFFFFFVETGKIYRQGCKIYCKGFWNWMEFIQITTAVASVVMFFLKEKYASSFVKHVRANPFKTSSTDYLVLWSETEIYLLSVVIFVVTIKFLRLIRFNHHVSEITNTIKDSAKGLASFFVVFFCILMAFTQLGYLIFGHILPAYSSFFNTMRAVLQMLLGGNMYFFELQSVHRVLGPMFVFVYMLSMLMVLLNMFMAIINESYMDVKYEDEDEEQQQQQQEKELTDSELGEFTKHYFATHIGYLRDELTQFLKRLACKSRRKAYINNSSADYVALPDEEPPAYSVLDDNELEEEKTRIPLASMDSLDSEGASDDELNDIKRSLSNIVSELRQSVASLFPKSDQMQLEEISGIYRHEPETTVERAFSIFDRQPTLLDDYEPYGSFVPSYLYRPTWRTSHLPHKNKESKVSLELKSGKSTYAMPLLGENDSPVSSLSEMKCSCEDSTLLKESNISNNGRIPNGQLMNEPSQTNETSV